MCLQSTEGSGQTASIAEGINEGDEGKAETTSADTELLMSPSRRITEDSVVSSMLGKAPLIIPNLCPTALAGQGLPKFVSNRHSAIGSCDKEAPERCMAVRSAREIYGCKKSSILVLQLKMSNRCSAENVCTSSYVVNS